MKADVRIIRLVRKIIRQQPDRTAWDEQEQDLYFATDYFDVMKVEKKELSSSFASIMGIWPDEKMDILDVAAKSYSLYCSAEMMKSETGKKECGDPFCIEDASMRFLSVIQIHITPEVMAHSLPEKSAREIMDAIYEDLHTAVSEFSQVNQCGPITFRIYKMLSAGDYALVLRSGKAETSFRVSSMLRRRFARGSEWKRLVLYKTYTLLTLNNDIIRQELGKQKASDETVEEETHRKACFVLRGCYSNLYWGNKEEADKDLKEKGIYTMIQLHGLNGRYDFSVRLTEKQFLTLLDDIKEYKKTGNVLSSAVEASENNGIVAYLRYLMEHHYLSYINERYLVAQEDEEESGTFCSEKLSDMIHAVTTESKEDYLENRINEIYRTVEEKCSEVRQEVYKIGSYRKNMNHYMDLIDKLIKLCYGINGFSDTRIYAAVLLEQLNVIIESIEVYIAIYRETEKKERILSLLEDYIRESVCALDKYAQYIRNNNLQSLQTPNYNIESNVSMEKLLIGYSEFLRVFTEFYQRKKMNPINRADQCGYLPIVVPALSKEDVSVETLFLKGVMEDWDREREIRAGKQDQYCMVISVPTLTELGNVRNMVTTLFHEVAHQFRYESRKERNDALLKYLVHAMMRDIIDEWRLRFQSTTGITGWNELLGKYLVRSFTDAYLKMNYSMDGNGELKYSFQEAPLTIFLERLRRDIHNDFGFWGKKSNIKSVLHIFLKRIMNYYRPGESQCQDAIEILNQFPEQDKSESYEIQRESESYEIQREKAVKCAYGLAWECACQKTGNTGRIWGTKKFKAWVKERETFDYRGEWQKAFGKIREEKVQSAVKEIWMVFWFFFKWMYDEYGSDEAAKNYGNAKRKEFLQKAYQNITEAWDGEEIQNCLKDDFDNNLSWIGRALGIDHITDENNSIFEKEIGEVVIQQFDSMMKMIDWRSRKYREETADMFMCNAMKLTPFGYLYLLAVNWPNNQEVPVEYASRSQNILLFQWCLDEKDELSYEKFRQLCVEMLRGLEEAVAGAACRICPGDAESGLPWENGNPVSRDDENQVIRMLDRAEELADYCEHIIGRNDVREKFLREQEYEMLKLYGIMAHMMVDIMAWGEEKICYFNDFAELREDYVRGVSNLKDLNEKMCEDEKPLVRRLGDFCGKISEMQNEPYKLMGNTEMKEKLNEYSIDFLLDMYCANKCQVAQRIGGGATCQL